ncbi:DUF4176 domain-containing protein [Cellulosilyticum lentocellum]|uniref:DUF4176 domain-containing protein n=1 Tax=Cellulosilyticum lentocellum (strain ATCC 49066 / DSM 5427 / NCIMB 11756 / RHM5) TaxID=642492 RepID=F2JHU1_CELLD|nr:DUF4176 domain-containing protein [Cellulosilyticum lentocellum]ADZ85433.1 hypothetical protein Clole_3753 [Cellulosilyticum lentocellum DSM 5427]
MYGLLPIGSVVLLKDSKKRLMIQGRIQKIKGTNEIWDYSGCYYPEGNINPESSYLFNHDQIERVYFIGFQDEEEIQLQAYLQQRLPQIREQEIKEEE